VSRRNEGLGYPPRSADGYRQVVSGLLAMVYALIVVRVCFQVPAITLEHGITLVVSPLIGTLRLASSSKLHSTLTRISLDARPGQRAPQNGNQGRAALQREHCRRSDRGWSAL
jgi:hypothetical protein